MSGYKLSKNAVRKTATVVNRVLGQRKPLGTTEKPEGPRDTWYWGKLATDLNAGSMIAPTTCEVDVWLPIPGNTDDPVQFAVATDSSLLGLTVVNRCPSIEATTGAVCKIEYAFGEWSIRAVEC